MYKSPSLPTRAYTYCKRHGFTPDDGEYYTEIMKAFKSGYESAMRDFNKLILPLDEE